MTKKTKAPEATDAEILFPEREIEINGEKVTVREFTFAQGLKAAHLAQPIVHDLGEVIRETNIEELSYDAIDLIFSDHAEPFMQLLSIASGLDVESIEKLPEGDGQLLAMTFWEVNSGFFTRRIVRRMAETMRKENNTASASSQPH